MDVNKSSVSEGGMNSSASVHSKLVSNELLYWGQLIGYVGLCGSVCLVGIVANIINIIVFVRQGAFKDSNTVSLLALSASDLLSLLTLLWLALWFLMAYVPPPGLIFHAMSMGSITGGRPHVMFVQITSWVTVYIAFERCICVVFPFKVGTIFTPRRTAMVIFSITVIVASYGYLPLFLVEHLRWQTSAKTNRTILKNYRTDDYKSVMKICSILNAPVSRTCTLTLVFLFTQITAFRVNASRKWRESTAAVSSQGPKIVGSEEGGKVEDKEVTKSVGSKDKRLVKMIRAICIIFLACLTPNLIFIIVRLIEPKIGPGNVYNNLFFLIYASSFFLEAVNATINIFVYYAMSTRYRKEFKKLFRMDDVGNS